MVEAAADVVVSVAVVVVFPGRERLRRHERSQTNHGTNHADVQALSQPDGRLGAPNGDGRCGVMVTLSVPGFSVRVP